MREAAVQQRIRLRAAEMGTPLLRNNRGAATTDDGRHVRFGLGNESAKINKRFKSSDLIGIWPVVIGPEHVGRTLGVFFAVESKASDWTYRETDEHDAAQARFGQWVTNHGGIFRFATDIKDVWK